MDVGATLLAAGYGVFMGTYPVPIKSPSVVAANVHPIMFQCWKSFWVMTTGFFFVIPVYAQGHTLQLSPWAIYSAACWVPSGLSTIAAVNYIGVSLTIVVSCAISSVASFLVFWLVLGEEIKAHHIGGHTVYLAPLWLFGCVLGMVALVYGPPAYSRRCAQRSKLEPADGVLHSNLLDEHVAPSTSADALAINTESGGAPQSASRFAFGILGCCGSGLFGAGQYAILTIGRWQEEDKAGCRNAPDSCPDTLKQAFDPLGSWSFMFGLGAAGAAAVLLLLYCVLCACKGWAPPSPEFRVMRGPGTLAGLLWCVGNLSGQLSVLKGGNSVEVPTMTSIQLIASGAWGIAYYKEVKGRGEIAIWSLAALWTLAMVLLLAMEKKK